MFYICATKTDLWCNGSIPDSGSVSPGSNPSRSAIISFDKKLIRVIRKV